jgi:hypothetical protein
LKQRPVDELRTSREDIIQRSVSGLSKAKSQVSFRIKESDNKRATAFNQDLALKLSYSWKNIYRSLLQTDVL